MKYCIRYHWGEPERAPYLSVLRENRIRMYVCVYGRYVIHVGHHASALACAHHKVQVNKERQHVPYINSKYSSPKLLQESWELVSGAEQQSLKILREHKGRISHRHV